jgi:phosphate transport system substrate-binding protein
MRKLSVIIIFILAISSCTERDKHGMVLDTPTAGSITISIDESLKPLIEAEISAFEGIYRNAHINVRYTGEGDAVNALMDDSARLIVITRRLDERETEVLAAQQIVSKQLTIATDGVALIVNRENPDTLIRLDDLRSILSGQPATHTRTPAIRPLEVVFEHASSGIIRFLKDSLLGSEPLPKYCFAVNGNAAVIDHVSETPHALGLIDISWISDRDDSTTNGFLKSIRVAGLANDSIFYQPYQAYIATRKYPLLRDVIMISREARAGLASGFMAFVASDKGQRIVLKSGLVPATMPIRIVEINREPL